MGDDVRADWKTEVGEVCDHAIRLSMVGESVSGDRGWTLEGIVDVPSLPANEAEWSHVGDILLREGARMSDDHLSVVAGRRWARTSWDQVPGGHGTVVEKFEPTLVITDDEIIDLKITQPPELSADAEERMSKMFERAWETSSREYPANPYLRFESRRQLSHRWASVGRNIMVVDHRGLQTASDAGMWFQLQTDILIETQWRGYPFSQESNLDWAAGSGVPQRHWDDALIERAASVLKGEKVPKGFVVKYGKAEHMRTMYEHGLVRIGSARRFKEAHSQAIQDDELKFEHRGVMVNGSFMVMSRFSEMFPTKRIEQYATLTLKSTADYWLYCVSRSLLPELFSDFDEADACVLFNWRQFCPRLMRAVRGKASTMRPRVVDVDYRDPLGVVGGTGIPAPVSDIKDFEYAYQNERRVVWKPSAMRRALAPLDVEVGPMREYATLIEL